jgi:hypothetical protein
MQSRSQRTVSRWKKRITDLITSDSAKILAACIPELRGILGVEIRTVAADIGLTSGEAAMRLKSILGSMFQTFALRNKVVI